MKHFFVYITLLVFGSLLGLSSISHGFVVPAADDYCKSIHCVQTSNTSSNEICVYTCCIAEQNQTDATTYGTYIFKNLKIQYCTPFILVSSTQETPEPPSLFSVVYKPGFSVELVGTVILLI